MKNDNQSNKTKKEKNKDLNLEKESIVIDDSKIKNQLLSNIQKRKQMKEMKSQITKEEKKQNE